MTHACIKPDPSAATIETSRSTHDDKTNAKLDLEASSSSRPAQNGDVTRKQQQQQPEDDGRNLDSGYAWLILAVMFLLASSTGGTNRVYGLIYAKQVAIGYYDHEQASWPIATASTVENLAGLLTPALAHFLTWRQIELMATLLFVIANVGAYFSDTLALDILCLGIIQGLALSMNTVLSLVINNDYFRRYRTTAYGIQLSGSTFGIIYLGPIVSWCLEQHELEFRSGYLAIGAVLALNALLVIFIKPRQETLGGSSRGAISAQAKRTKPQPQSQADSKSKPKPKPTAVDRKRSLLERHLERKNSVATIALMCKQKRQSELQLHSTLRSSLIIKDVAASAEAAQVKRKQQQQQQNVASTADLVRGGKNFDIKKSVSTGVGLQSEQQQPAAEASHRMSIFSAPHLAQSKQQHNDETGHFYAANMMSSCCEEDAAKNKTDNNNSSSNCTSTGNLFPTNLSQAGSLSNRSSFSSQLGDASREHDDANNNNNNYINQEPEQTSKAPDRRLPCTKTTPTTGDSVMTKTTKATETETTIDNEHGAAETDEALSWELVGALLRSPYLHCVWIMLSLYYLIARIFIIILVDLAKDNGLSSGESRALLNYWSVGEIVGRIILCSFVDLQWLSVRACILLTCTSMSVCIGLMALLAGSFYLYAICSALVAALISLEYVLINVLMIEYLGQARVTSCYSLGSFISSLALLGRPALIGLFRDQLGSYNGLLLLLAGLSLAYGLLFGLTEPLLVHYWPKRRLLNRGQLLLLSSSSSSCDSKSTFTSRRRPSPPDSSGHSISRPDSSSDSKHAEKNT